MGKTYIKKNDLIENVNALLRKNDFDTFLFKKGTM